MSSISEADYQLEVQERCKKYDDIENHLERRIGQQSSNNPGVD